MQALTSRDISAVLALVTRQRGLGRGRGPGTQQRKVPWDKEASCFQEGIRDTWVACCSGEAAVLSDAFFVGPRSEP